MSQIVSNMLTRVCPVCQKKKVLGEYTPMGWSCKRCRSILDSEYRKRRILDSEPKSNDDDASLYERVESLELQYAAVGKIRNTTVRNHVEQMQKYDEVCELNEKLVERVLNLEKECKKLRKIMESSD